MQLRLRSRQSVAMLLVASITMISGCGTAPQAVPPVADASGNRPFSPPSAMPAAPVARALPALPPAGSGRGGYYQDDGPGEAPPDGLHELPDAIPKVEPYTRRGNRPYVVFGKSYTPFTDDRPLKQRGIGSWYGKKFHGQTTSSGEIYDMYKMTAAHPTLPLPSYARVTNVRNNKQVIVRVNDRGPFHAGRIIDLSYTAALKLEYISRGSAELEVERLLPDEIARINSARLTRPEGDQAVTSSFVQTTSVVQPVALVTEAMPGKDLGQAVPMAVSDIAPAERANPVTVTGTAASGGFYLQLGAYGSAANAEIVRIRLSQSWNAALPPLEVVQNGALYRIFSGPFVSRGEADAGARQVEAGGAANPVIVQR